MKKKINIFKPYLSVTSTYVGGKSKSEVGATEKIYKLSSNENPLGPSPRAIKAIENQLHTLHEYSDYTGERFRDALEKFYDGELGEDQFVSANSGVDLLEMICRAFLDPGHESIICSPCFGPYALFTKKCGGTVIDIPLKGSAFNLNVHGILDAITDQTRLIFLANPNNPTGTHIGLDAIHQLLEGIPDHVVVVYDEVYQQFVQTTDYTTGVSLVQKGYPVIGINSFSKAYGLGGLRVGYAYSTQKLANYLRQIRRPFMLSSLAQAGGIAALQDKEHIDKTVKLVNSEKPRLYKAFDKIDLKYWKSEANFILIKPELDSRQFTEQMLEEGIMVRPMEGFGAPGCIRVTIGTSEANDAFIKALRKIMA
ncbi:MAG: histidinol-phosphate transaminase [Bacteroidia bacterium]|nr:histidinol-phosphate transaminase [Bacteroidia bacterium]